MEIQVLGRPAVRIGGEPVELTGRQPALLGALVVAAPRPVSSDALVEVVWRDDQPADPANALQQRISALRRALDPDRAGDVLVTVPGGYGLRVDPDHLDVHRFERLASQGRDRLAAGDAEAARSDLDAALTLWRGPAFDGVAHEPWAVVEVQRLEQLRLSAREDRIEAALALGAGGDLVPELSDLVAAEPLRERLSGQLMRALYRAGRQADALAEYERIRHELADELGVDPGPALRRIHLQVLEQAEDLEVEVLSTPPRARAATNVPAATRPVIGRADDLDRVAQLLAASRLVTLTGPGGAGKTTLALKVARQLPVPDDGTWFVDLAPLRDGGALVHTVASTLGLGGDVGAVGGSELDGPRLGQLLHDRSALLVFDNCEHVVEDVAGLVHAVLTQAPDVRVLATSREPLAIDGELVWSLPTLGVPDPDAGLDEVLSAPAVQLLVDRIQTHEPAFVLDAASAPAAATIVRRLDGIPLAIELAAARHRVLPLDELAAAMDDRFALLTDTRRTASTRQRTLRGAIDWSWDLLDREQRVAWAALSVPVESADRSMVQALLAAGGATGEPLDLLRDLVDRSLLAVTSIEGVARYRMLESLRAYGQERLRDLDLEAAVRERHADVVEEVLARCTATDDPTGFGVDLVGLRHTLGEARAALRWAVDVGDRRRVQRLAGRLGWLWLLGGFASEGLRWLDEGFGAVEGAPPDNLDLEVVDPEAALWASGLRTTRFHPHAEGWAELARVSADRPDRAVLAELFAAIHLAHQGEADAAIDRLEAAVIQAEDVGGWLPGFAHLLTAQIGRVSGRFDRVRAHAEAALEVLELPWARVQAIDIVIDAADPAADIDAADPAGGPERARQLATEGLALCRRNGMPELEGRMLLQLGVAASAMGDEALGTAYLEQAVELTARAGRGPSLGFALLVTGEHALRRGDLGSAHDQLLEARELLAATGLGYGTARAGLALGRALLENGDVEAARALAEEAGAASQAIGDPALLADHAALSAAIEQA